MSISTKRKALILAALALLFASRWVFYRTEIDTWIDTPAFIAECAVFLLVFALCLFGVNKTVSCFALAACCVGTAFFYDSADSAGFFQKIALTTTYGAPLLFLIDIRPSREDGLVFRLLRQALMLAVVVS
ncbi:MAG: hypothetical protein K6C36_04320, partial [Clostridia bacterium]|nr:hypothetical protein [Clostridia bacterium]